MMASGNRRFSTFNFVPSSRVELPDTDEEDDETWQETVRHVASSTNTAGPIYRRGIRTTYSTSIERHHLNDRLSASHPSHSDHETESQPQASTSTLRVSRPKDDEDDDDDDDEDIHVIDVADFVAYNEDKGKRVSQLL